MFAMCGIFPCCDEPRNTTDLENYNGDKPIKIDNYNVGLIQFVALVIWLVSAYICYKCCLQKILAEHSNTNTIIFSVLFISPVIALLSYYSGFPFWIALIILALCVCVFIILDNCIGERYKKDLFNDFGRDCQSFTVEDENKRVVVEVLAFNSKGEEITIEEAFTLKPAFSFRDYADLLFYSVPSQFKKTLRGLKCELESWREDVPITEEEFSSFENLRRLSKRLHGNRVTLKITHKDAITGEVDLTVSDLQKDVQDFSQNYSAVANNVSRSSSTTSLDRLSMLSISSLKSVVSDSLKYVSGSQRSIIPGSY